VTIAHPFFLSNKLLILLGENSLGYQVLLLVVSHHHLYLCLIQLLPIAFFNNSGIAIAISVFSGCCVVVAQR